MVGDTFLKQLDRILRAADSDAALFEAIVNAPFHKPIKAAELDLGIVVLLQVNKSAKTIDRVALSDTEAAIGTVKMSEKPFKEIRIPLGHPENAIAQAIATSAPKFVSDWKYLFIPAMDAEAARFNQAGGGIEFSVVFPLRARDGGALIFSYYQIDKNISQGHHTFMQAYVKLVEKLLAREQQANQLHA